MGKGMGMAKALKEAMGDPVEEAMGASVNEVLGDPVKEAIGNVKRQYRDINRQELRSEPKGKALKDDTTLAELGLNSGAMLYFKDRGLQIGWTTVFLSEYAGPLLVYLWISTRPWFQFFLHTIPNSCNG